MSIRIAVRSDDADRLEKATGEITSIVDGWGGRVDVTVNPSLQARASEQEKFVDPISAAALILSLPGAVLAAMDLADRIAKRRRAKQLIDAAKRLSADGGTELWIMRPSGPSLLSHLTPDEVLKLSDDHE